MVFAFAGLSTIRRFFDIVQFRILSVKKIRQPNICVLTVTVDTTRITGLSTWPKNLISPRLHSSRVILTRQDAYQIANIETHQGVIQVAE